jgi:hypothetical protein
MKIEYVIPVNIFIFNFIFVINIYTNFADGRDIQAAGDIRTHLKICIEMKPTSVENKKKIIEWWNVEANYPSSQSSQSPFIAARSRFHIVPFDSKDLYNNFSM